MRALPLTRDFLSGFDLGRNLSALLGSLMSQKKTFGWMVFEPKLSAPYFQVAYHGQLGWRITQFWVVEKV